MPSVNSNIGDIGRGFAAFLAPPPEDVIRFTVGQPDFRTPQSVVDTAKKALDDGLHGYTRSQGSEEVCDAVATHLSKYGLNVDPLDVVISPGCKQSLLYAMMTCLNPGDEVILFSPAWPSYDGMLKLIGAVPIHVPVHRENYHPDIEATRSAITEKTKAIIINSPNNPTGAVYHPDEIEALVQIANEFDLWIFDDMIYSDLVYCEHPYVSPATFEGGHERTLTIGGWSKIWAMTGWRLGYSIWPSKIIEHANKLCVNNHSCPTSISQYAGLEAIKGPQIELKKIVLEFQKRKEFLHHKINKLDKISCFNPGGAFYAFPNISKTGLSGEEFCSLALEDKGVALVPGTSFGNKANEFVRISFANSLENIDEAIKRISTI